MRYYFAPMEGVTGAVYRRTHHEYFPGIDKYFMPFITPTTNERLTPRQKRDVAPEANQGVPAVPQLLTRTAADFIWAANALFDLGYSEVNLNLGCPSGTVTAKGKGAGFLGDPDGLDRFLDAVFSACRGAVSVKTRLGMRDPAEFSRLLEIYNRYPIAELTIHPRVRQDFYKGRVREADFAAALPQCRMPVCYNGDVVSEADAAAVGAGYPAVQAIMVGRGLIADPALLRRARGGPAASKEELRGYFAELYAGYTAAFGSPQAAISRMKAHWHEAAGLFEGSDKLAKQLKKLRDPWEYEVTVGQLFTLPLRK